MRTHTYPHTRTPTHAQTLITRHTDLHIILKYITNILKLFEYIFHNKDMLYMSHSSVNCEQQSNKWSMTTAEQLQNTRHM